MKKRKILITAGFLLIGLTLINQLWVSSVRADYQKNNYPFANLDETIPTPFGYYASGQKIVDDEIKEYKSVLLGIAVLNFEIEL